MTTGLRHPDALVSSDWLAAHLDDPAVRVFECTTILRYREPGGDAPYDVVSGRPDYLAGHIPGAAFLELQDELSDCTSAPHLRFRMLPLPALAQAFARAGIGDGVRVVLYARGAMQWATRVWWMLRAVGFDAAAVLDGGFEKWVREGRALDTGERRFDAAVLTARPRPQLFVDRDAVRAAMGDGSCRLINALSPRLHRGENARYGRPGRIPGSVNLPATALVDRDSNTLIAPEAARAALAAVGAGEGGRNIVYCGGGIAATLDAFVMWQLGYEDVAVYDASMSEWARDPALPIETG